jgi:hypothetical protein
MENRRTTRGSTYAVIEGSAGDMGELLEGQRVPCTVLNGKLHV